MMAAITASDKGAKVTIYEKTDRVGKKILATGNGKCNLSNTNMELYNYYTEDKKKLSRCFERFSSQDTINFFEKQGMMIRSKDGYLYPYCEQASVVLDILRSSIARRGIDVFTAVENIAIFAKKNGKFVVESTLGKKEFDRVILACGSRAGVKNMTTEGLDYAKAFGHSIIPVLPALVQVRCEGDFFKSVAGVRCKAKITLYSEKELLAKEQGELQLTDYGISGIPVFQISRVIAKQIHKRNKVEVEIDFLPDISAKDWDCFVKERVCQYHGYCCEDFLTGILHKKVSLMLLKEFGLKPSDILNQASEENVYRLCKAMKEFRVIPKGVNSYEQAQVCCGGVDFSELDDTMQSVYQPGLYMCGEMIDVDGKCGGYNLQWAWTSGYIAGVSAAVE